MQGLRNTLEKPKIGTLRIGGKLPFLREEYRLGFYQMDLGGDKYC